MARRLFSILPQRLRGSPNICGNSSSPRTQSPTDISSAPSTVSATEKPWSIGEFYGKSYFCNPRGKIVAQASRDKDEVLVADLDLDMILEVRKVWQFFRDRRPESYGILTKQSAKATSGDASRVPH